MVTQGDAACSIVLCSGNRVLCTIPGVHHRCLLVQQPPSPRPLLGPHQLKGVTVWRERTSAKAASRHRRSHGNRVEQINVLKEAGGCQKEKENIE